MIPMKSKDTRLQEAAEKADPNKVQIAADALIRCFIRILRVFGIYRKEDLMAEENHSGVTDTILSQCIVDMAVESWRIRKVFERMLKKIDAGEQNRYNSQFIWFIKRIEDSLDSAGLKIVNVEGNAYDTGIAAAPLNIEEFSADDDLIIDQMIEPIIVGKNGLVRTGSVTLRKAII